MNKTPADPPTVPESAWLSARYWTDPPTTDATATADEPVWRPDGRCAAYILSERRFPLRADYRRESLCVLRVLGPNRYETRRLYTARYPSDDPGPTMRWTAPYVAGWSPDGQRILFWKLIHGAGSANADGSPLFDIPATGGTPRLLTVPDHRNDEPDGLMRKPGTIRFSPDGTRLLLVVGFSRFFVESKRLTCLTYPGGRRLWRTPARFAAHSPAWSPNGRQIVYVQTPDGSNSRENITTQQTRTRLWVITADGGDARQLTHDPRYRDADPRWETVYESGQPVPVIRFTRYDNSDVTGQASWGALRSLWQVRPDGTGLRFLKQLPPEPGR